MSGWTYGESASNPSVSGNSGNGTVTYQYKVSTAGDGTYTSTKPSDAGTYTVKATVAQTTNYNEATATTNFTVGTASLTITAKPKTITYGDLPANDGVTYSGFVSGDNESALSGTLSYSYSYAQYGDVGEYFITPSGLSGSNYAITFSTGVLTVIRKSLSVTADDKNKLYRDADPAFTATVVGLVGTDTEELITYTLSRAVGEDVGEYVVTASGEAEQGNYLVSYYTGTLTIGQRTIIDPTLTLSRISYPYDADQSASPRVAMTDGAVLIPETEYTVTYINNLTPGVASGTNPPSAIVSDVAGGNYIITFTTPADATVTFTIVPGQSYIQQVPQLISGIIYDGIAHALITEGTAISGTVKYRIGTTGDWNTTIPTATDAGTYVVYYMVEGNANYNDWNGGSANGQSLTVVIAKRAVTVAVIDKQKVYDNNASTDPELTAIVTGVVVGDNFDYALLREEGQDAGEYVISVQPGSNPNYDVLVQNGTFSIAKKALTITADSDSKVYDGETLTKHSYVDTGVAESDHIESVSFVGSQTIVGECANVPENALILCGERDVTANYEITYVSGLLTVDYATITDISVAQSGEMQYSGQNQRATVFAEATTQGGQAVTFTYCETANGTYVSVVPEFSAIGEHIVYYIASASEHNSESGSFVITIDRKDITGASITLGERLIYTGEEQTQSIDSVIKDGLNVSYSVTGNNIIAAGEYTMTITGTGNFIGVITKDFVVAERDITIVVDTKSKTYGDPDPEWTASVLNNTGIDDIEYTLYREEGENVGEYAIRVELGENAGYTIVTVENVFTINPRAIGVAWSTEEFIYNGQEQAPTATATGLAFDDEVVLLVTGGTNAGQHTATATFATAQPNYVLPVGTTDYTIAPKAVTVTIDSKSNSYGSPVQVALTATDDGIVDGDDVYSLSCEVTSASNVGTYDITATATNANYIVTFVNCENAYSVTKKELTVTAEAQRRVYGDLDPALTYTVAGLVGNDVISGALVRREGENVGEYDIEIGTLDAGDNYEMIYVGAKLTINKKALTVMAKSETILLNDDAPEYAASFRGFVLDDDRSILNGELILTCDYEKGDDIGVYSITPSGVSNDNYDITFVSGELTVKPIVIDTSDVKVTIYNEEGEEEQGFDLDIQLQVEVKTTTKEKEQEKAKSDIPETANLGEKELVAAIYNVKLIRTINENGLETVEEIQPDDIKPGTSIVVAMQVPESVGNKDFRIVHVHSETDVEEVEYTREGDTVYVTVNRLSDFAFVVEDTRVNVGGMKLSRRSFAIILIFLLILLIISIIVYIRYRKRENKQQRKKR